MHKILQNHLLCACVANLKIDALYPESLCDKNLAIRKVFAFCDSGHFHAFKLKAVQYHPFIPSDREATFCVMIHMVCMGFDFLFHVAFNRR